MVSLAGGISGNKKTAVITSRSTKPTRVVMQNALTKP